MRRFIVAAIASLVVAAFTAVPAAATSTGTPGQPNQDCEALLSGGGSQPAGFGEDGFANAQGHYADQPANSNSHAVSQYDVACFQLSTPQG